jgi:bacillolysin
MRCGRVPSRRPTRFALAIGLLSILVPLTGLWQAWPPAAAWATGGAPQPLPWNPPASVASAATDATAPDDSSFDHKRPAESRGASRDQAPAPADVIAGVRARLDLLREADHWGLTAAVDAGYLVTAEAVADLGRLKAAQPQATPLQIDWHRELRTPRFIAGVDLLPDLATAADPAAAAMQFLQAHRALLRIADPSTEFVVLRVERDRDGSCAVRFEQRHQGLPVWGDDVLVRLDGRGRVVGFSGHYCPTPPATLTTAGTIDREQAQAAALAALAAADGVRGEVEAAQLLFYAHGDALRPAWSIRVRDGLAYRKEAFIDAVTGEFLHAVDLVAHDAELGESLDLHGITRTLGLWEESGTYYMIDTRKAMFDGAASDMPGDPRGALWTMHANHTQLRRTYQVTSTDPDSWPGRANAVSASVAMGYGYDFWLDTFGRNSYDNAGRTITAVVDVGTKYNNAFWNGDVLAFGNGDGTTFSDFTGSIDVVCHELGHAVIENTANLVYEYQPGAMNEHFADVFGALTEWYAADHGERAGNWMVGEDVTTPGTAGDCLRNMADPAAPNVYDPPSPHYPTNMSEYFDLSYDDDYGGVHINNTILSRAFVIVCDGIGRDKGSRIWYRALTQYLNRNSEFVDLRIGALQSAADLYGADGAEVQAVALGFDTVGVVGDEGTEDPPDLPDNTGADYVAIQNTQRGAQQGHIMRAAPDWNGSGALEDISGNVMGDGGRPSFSDNGQEMAWVDETGNIFVAHSNGAARRQVTTDDEWWSVAMSPDGRYVAATTIHEDRRIYIFDLQTPGNDTYFELTTQNDSGGGADNVVFADVMEYTVPGDYILYDALNRAMVEGGTVEYWDLNMLRLADGACFRIFQQLPRGESVGDPALAQNRDDLIVYDHMDSRGHVNVMATHLTTGVTGLVAENGTQLGCPTFAGDDASIYYQSRLGPIGGIWRMGLETDGVTGTGDSEVFAYNYGLPVWFTVGARPSPALLDLLTGFWSQATIELTWRAPDESGLAGYHIERSLAGPDGGATGFERRNQAMIPAAGEPGAICRFRDEAPAAPLAWYAIIGVGRDGTRTRLGTLELARDARPRSAVAVSNDPNPFRGETRIELRLSAPARRADLRVYDVAGRLVAWPVRGEPLGSGPQTLVWQARDLAGRPLAAGDYYLQLDTGTSRVMQRIIVIR